MKSHTVYAGDKLRHTHSQKGRKVIKEVINHREQCQRVITLPLSKHWSHSALLVKVLPSPRQEILAFSLKIITKITSLLLEISGQLHEMLSSRESSLFGRKFPVDLGTFEGFCSRDQG